MNLNQFSITIQYPGFDCWGYLMCKHIISNPTVELRWNLTKWRLVEYEMKNAITAQNVVQGGP